jgi:hypothetical protein
MGRENLSPTVDSGTLAELLPLVRRFATGRYGIALGGAHAKGVEDGYSDLDLYLFAERWLPSPAREQVCRVVLGAETQVVSWSADRDEGIYEQAGTDFTVAGRRVECWLRGVEYVSGIVGEAVQGIVHREFVTWTVMGYFNHCTLSDLKQMVVLEDPEGLLARWQAQVTQYPPALRDAIVQTHLAAAQFWPQNFHYESAVARGDIIYAMAIVQQVVQNLIQVVFALNDTYFPGEKKLAGALDGLTKIPEQFGPRMEALVCPRGETRVETLQHQRMELEALVSEVTGLADR